MTNGEKIKEIFPNGIYPSSGTWMCMEYKEPTTKNDLGVDCIDRAELLKAMDTWDKFGYLAHDGLIRLGKENKYYVQYVRYEDMVNCVKGMSSVTPQEPIEKCTWIKYDYRTMCPKEHIDVDNPYWRIPENRMETLKYCPYCGKEIEVEVKE